MKKPRRSPSFVPQLLLILSKTGRFVCKFSELPKSYQAQPHNLAAKVAERGAMQVNTVFNKANDTFCLIKVCNLTKSL